MWHFLLLCGKQTYIGEKKYIGQGVAILGSKDLTAQNWVRRYWIGKKVVSDFLHRFSNKYHIEKYDVSTFFVGNKRILVT